MPLVEADPAYEERVISALWKFTNLMRPMLADNHAGYPYHDGDKSGQDDTQRYVQNDLRFPFREPGTDLSLGES